VEQIIRVGIIGMGGFAGHHHASVKLLEDRGECKLVCTCDPDPGAFEGQIREWDLPGRGVAVFDDYRSMLDACHERLDLVIIPTPVHLHASMHRACVELGLPVYLEKPPTLDCAELDEMLAVEERAGRLTNVGFNFIIDSHRQQLKRRVVDGEFGAVRLVCFSGLWPRPTSYFLRNQWAGRLTLDSQLVLDSCMGNAMAHYVHNALFWAGSGELFSWGEASEVAAELYRAHDIQGMDTVFIKARTQAGPDLQMALSHACDGESRNPEWVVCDDAVIRYTTGEPYEIEWNDGRTETGGPDAHVGLPDNLLAYLAYLRGDADRPMTRLIDSRPFVRLCDLAYVSAGKITTVPPEHTTRSGEYVSINGLPDIVDEFFRAGLFPSEQHVAWARPGGSATISDLPKLRDIVLAMT